MAVNGFVKYFNLNMLSKVC